MSGAILIWAFESHGGVCAEHVLTVSTGCTATVPRSGGCSRDLGGFCDLELSGVEVGFVEGEDVSVTGCGGDA